MSVRRIAKVISVAAYRPIYPILNALGIGEWVKSRYEMAYWRAVWRDEGGTLKNSWYETYYTTAVGLTRQDYEGKRVLDIGCGPRGSLEWCDGALERVGLDPLVHSYRRLGIDRHKMSYVNAPSEKMPFADGYFDIVLSKNSLDHVEDLDRTIHEIKRVTKSGGLFVLMVEVNHKATIAEPHEFGWDAPRRFEPEMVVTFERHLESTSNVDKPVPYDHADKSNRTGWIFAVMRRH
ncbi:MAG: class I SAM-dependent methyltransferase [Phycisphaerales bacterium]